MESDDDWVHYVGNLNNFSASFHCMYFFNIVRRHSIFIFNTKRSISSFFLRSVAEKFESLSEVWLFWSPSHWNACAQFKLEHCTAPPHKALSSEFSLGYASVQNLRLQVNGYSCDFHTIYYLVYAIMGSENFYFT